MQTNTPCEIILADGAGHTNAHPQQLGYLTNPLAIVPRCERPLVQILRISPASLVRHPRLRFTSSDSTRPENALKQLITKATPRRTEENEPLMIEGNVEDGGRAFRAATHR
jgi:hypothetical protein